MRKGDMPPPVPERIAIPRIREDRAVQDFRQNSEKMHPKAENIDKPISSKEKFNVTNDPHLSLLTEFWGKQLRACDLDSLPTDAKGIASGLWLSGMPFEQKQLSVSSRQN